MARQIETTTQASDRLSRESKDMREALLEVLRHWGLLEQWFATILQGCLGDQPQHMAVAIFFAPANTETRMAIVDAAFRITVRGTELEKDAVVAWDQFTGRVNRQKNVRNMAVHGEIAPVMVGGRPTIRLTYSLLDAVRRLHRAKPRQPEGMSVADVQQHVQAIASRIKEAEQLALFVHHLRNGDRDASLRTLQELSRPATQPNRPARATFNNKKSRD